MCYLLFVTWSLGAIIVSLLWSFTHRLGTRSLSLLVQLHRHPQCPQPLCALQTADMQVLHFICNKSLMF